MMTLPKDLRGSVLPAWICLLVLSCSLCTTSLRAAPGPVSLATLPLWFEANRGQANDSARFIARTAGGVISLGATQAVFTLRASDASPTPTWDRAVDQTRNHDLRVNTLLFGFIGANAQAQISGAEELPGKVNYFNGGDPTQWKSGLPLFARLRVENLYRGIDLFYYGNHRQLEYDFVVAPGADPGSVAFRITGATEIKIDGQGDLILHVGTSRLSHHRPVIYQLDGGQRKEITGGYRLQDSQTVSFRIGPYNPRLPLIIDPVLGYSSFLGGLGNDAAAAVVLDDRGNVYVAGGSLSPGLGTANAFQPDYAGGYPGGLGDAFVAKFDPTGSSLLYLTYIGGNGDEVATAIALDTDGNAYITGVTDSTNFPIAGVTIYPRISGQGEFFFGVHPYDAFVAKLNSEGSQLMYSTYLGGKEQDEGLAIAVDSSFCAYVAGFTASTDFPIVNPLQSANAGDSDIFVTKIASSGSSILYSTYLGGTGNDHAHSIAIDDLGRTYITGFTTSTNFPVPPTAFQTNRPVFTIPAQAFVCRLARDGTALERSTYLGGIGSAIGSSIALGRDGTVYVAGLETGPGFPATPGNLNPGGIFKSRDGAANWVSSNVGLFYDQVQGIGIDPVNPANLYIGTGRGIARSTDGGATWQTSLDSFSQFVSFVVDPTTPSTVYAGATNVLKSTDSGLSWFSSSTGMTIPKKQSGTNQSLGFVNKLVIDPTATSTLYAGTGNGVYKTTDGAANWKTANNGLGSKNVTDLAIDPQSPATLYAATSSGVFRSVNNGGSWAAFNQGLTNLLANALTVSSGSPPTIYMGTIDGQLFKRANSATNWIPLNSGSFLSNTISVLATDPRTPTTIYAGARLGLFKSLDAGDSWNVVTNGLPPLPAVALAIDPASPSTLYVGTYNSFAGTDAFLTRLSPDLDALIHSVVFGGDGTDQGMALALDALGNAFVVGSTTSFNFPTVQPIGYRGALNSGLSDAFVTVVNPDASAFVYSTYLGGFRNDAALGIALDRLGTAWVVGQTFSPDFPTVAPFQSSFRAPSDAFLAKIQIPYAPVHVAIQTIPPGVSVFVDGAMTNTPAIFDWAPASFHLVSALPQSTGLDTQLAWTSWSDGGDLVHWVSYTNDAILVAAYKTQYFLSMTAVNPGVAATNLQSEASASGAIAPGSGWYDPGTQVLISAVPPQGGSFSGWLGAGNGSFSGADNPATVTMNGPIAEIANFAGSLTNRLKVIINGNGSLNPNLDGQSLKVGNTYSMTAKPGSGFVFSNWTFAVIAGDPVLRYAGVATTPKLTFVMFDGMVLQANFIPSPFGPVQGSYAGLFFATNAATANSSGFFTANVTDLGKFTAKFRLGNIRFSWSGQFNSLGLAAQTFILSSGASVQVALQLDLTGGNVLRGLITTRAETAELIANRNVYSTGNPPPQAGKKYTLLIPGGSDSITLPAGDCFGTVTVDNSGNVRFSGTLADGTTISQSTFLSANGEWPFFASLYGGSGSILGWLTFAATPEADLSGAVAWFKQPVFRATLYPAGFTIENEATGSLYSFTKAVPVLDFGQQPGQLVLQNGKVFPSITNYVFLDANNKVTSTNQMSLSINTSSGLFQGSVTDPVARKTLSIRGAILQKQNRGGGFFLNDGQAGGVLLLPPNP